MRPVKLAIAAALADDEAIANLVSPAQIFSVERVTVPTLPAVEIIAVNSERIDTGPMIRHAMSVEVTASDPTEDGADETLDSIVAAVRRRLLDAEIGTVPIVLPSGAVAVVELQGSRWSISANDQASVIRGASVSLSVVASV